MSGCRQVSDCRSRVRKFDPGRSHIFVEIDHEIICMAILLPSPDSRRAIVSYNRKYVLKVLVNGLIKLAQEKSVVRWTDLPIMTITVDWEVKHQTKMKKKYDVVCVEISAFMCLTLCILMNFPTIRMVLSIIYFKGSLIF